ncbi:uncharacterized protein LOC143915880 [Arctopsyche grandis]|uniref:uncharacterized protein LOC143915880 n=1 Tax=Arctopsyche grandis TaxID=121162 RepID=UPI00406D8A3A
MFRRFAVIVDDTDEKKSACKELVGLQDLHDRLIGSAKSHFVTQEQRLCNKNGVEGSKNKSEKRKEAGLKRLWSAVKSSSGNSSQSDEALAPRPAPTCSLPLLQVWPSQDSPRQSPRGEGDGQSFIFPPERRASSSLDCPSPKSPLSPRSQFKLAPPALHPLHALHVPTAHDQHLLHDSGIDSVQASPSPGGPGSVCGTGLGSPGGRRPSSGLLHPDHARLLRQPAHTSAEDVRDISPSSSTTSSLTSVAAPTRHNSTWQPNERRRSSTMTARYSLFDALDLEYALLRAAARGSVGPYSLSESLHKLTFTQSLAFPALARGLAGKRSRAAPGQSARPLEHGESGLNAFAKVITTLVLVLVSVLVFGVVYKFVRT